MNCMKLIKQIFILMIFFGCCPLYGSQLAPKISTCQKEAPAQTVKQWLEIFEGDERDIKKSSLGFMQVVRFLNYVLWEDSFDEL